MFFLILQSYYYSFFIDPHLPGQGVLKLQKIPLPTSDREHFYFARSDQFYFAQKGQYGVPERIKPPRLFHKVP